MGEEEASVNGRVLVVEVVEEKVCVCCDMKGGEVEVGGVEVGGDVVVAGWMPFPAHTTNQTQSTL